VENHHTTITFMKRLLSSQRETKCQNPSKIVR
jgi:hypothetical protein